MRCPNEHCQAENPPDRSACRVCQTPLASVGSGAAAYAEATPPQAPSGRRQHTVVEPGASEPTAQPPVFFARPAPPPAQRPGRRQATVVEPATEDPDPSPMLPAPAFYPRSTSPKQEGGESRPDQPRAEGSARRAPAVLQGQPAPVAEKPARPPLASPPAAAPARRKDRTVVVGDAEVSGAPRVRTIRAVLVEFRGPDDPGRVHPLYEGRNAIGRDSECDVILDDPNISKMHGFIYVDDEGSRIVDNSQNGTIVAGRTLRGAQSALTGGTRIDLGEVRFVFVPVPTPFDP